MAFTTKAITQNLTGEWILHTMPRLIFVLQYIMPLPQYRRRLNYKSASAKKGFIQPILLEIEGWRAVGLNSG
jgi:hypothetical protein